MDTEAEASCEIDLEAEVDRVIEKEIKEEEIVVIPLNKNESFTCDECGKSKKTLKQLLDHKRVHKKVTCDKCQKTISYIRRSKHKCKGILYCDDEECSFQTKYKEIMLRHKRIHQRHMCEECGHLAKTVTKLNKHKEEEHRQVPEAEFKCSFCDYKSNRKNNRDIHTKNYCKEKRRQDGIDDKVVPITPEETMEWFRSTNCTKSDFNILLMRISERYPRILERGCKVNIA